MDKLDTRRSPYPYDTTRVSELLKSKRRVRGIKSCFPCRHRKVKCDGNFPCETCVLRGHPEICCAPSGSTGPSQVESASATNEQFGPGQQLLTEANDAEDINIQSSPAQSSITGIDIMLKRLESIETQISALKTDLRQSRATLSASGQDTSHARPSYLEPVRDSRSLSSGPSQSLGRNFVEESTGATIFLGNYSDPPAALGCRKVGGDTTVPDALLLEQVMPRTYPFTSLWGPDADLAEVCGTLPEDSNIIRYWQNYQTTAYPFYPGLVQLQEFNNALFQFLDRRAEAQLANEKLKAQDLDTSWLALLFSVLACGVQFSDDPVKERDLQSKVFVCSSFQCLRMSDFFTKTDMNQIQALALIGHCLRNNLDANSAWILMGTTLRLAQSIGLHEVTFSRQSSTKTLDYQKRRLWWVLIWQDVFLAFTYDRSPTTVTPSSSFPYEDESRTEPGNRSYSECILTLIQILLERSKKDHIDMTTTIAYKKRMEAILTDEIAAPFLRDKSHCHTLLNHLERLALRVHVCYGIQRLCRLMLEMPSNELSIVGGTEETKRECINRATEAVEAFLDMHRLSSLVCRSWAFVHNAVSCAFALQNLGATGSHSRASSVVSRLVVVLENEEVQATWQDLDTNVRYFGPYSRASKALKEAIATTPS